MKEIFKKVLLWKIVGAVLVIVLIYFLVIKPLVNESVETVNEQYISDPENILVAETALPLDDFAYKSIADTQYNALNGWFTSLSDLTPSLEGLNSEEMKMVAKKFGKRTSTFFNVGITANIDILTWYNQDLSESELEIMETYWANTGLW